jgi:tRNA1Val (adenine37-N6)-methyltransferase
MTLNPNESPVGTDETLDTCGKGSLKILQKKTGYRFSIDPFILFDFVRVKTGHRLLDLGTGSGILALLLARANPRSRLTALDLSPVLLDLARRNAFINGLEERIAFIKGDMGQIPNFLKEETFDGVVTNPPYRPLHSGRINPDPQKALARHEIKITLPQMVKSVNHCLKPKGRWYVIYPAWRMVSLLSAARQQALEPKRLRVVHSFADKEAEWVLIEAVKGGREELKILPPLIVYQSPGVYTPYIQKLLSGEELA